MNAQRPFKSPRNHESQESWATKLHVHGRASVSSADDERESGTGVHRKLTFQREAEACGPSNMRVVVDEKHGAPEDWYESATLDDAGVGRASDSIGASASSIPMSERPRQQRQRKSSLLQPTMSSSIKKESKTEAKQHAVPGARYTGTPTRPVTTPRIDALSVPKVSLPVRSRITLSGSNRIQTYFRGSLRLAKLVTNRLVFLASRISSRS